MGYKLPRTLRESFRDPIGKLFTGNYHSAAKKASKYIQNLKPPVVMSIGDFCTKTLLDIKFFPDIIVYDNKTHRIHEIKLNLDLYKRYNAVNPPEWILKSTWNIIKTAIGFCIENNCRVAVHITGEEDLIVIPAIISLPLGSVVVYGQPKINTEEGIVVAQISSALKMLAQDLLDKFEFIEKFEDFTNGDQFNGRKI
ncbi:MAG: GTP-dependent dephospho-CoA kinase family protein [Candidatus Hodarchaeales archaeon]